MAELIVIDEFHLTVSAPRGLRESRYAASRRALDGRRFRAALVSAAQRVCRRHAALRHATVSLSR